MNTPSNMYAGAETWNPFQGCGFDCVYCESSFQRQAKRQKQRCEKCYDYTPHCHDNRLSDSIASTPIVFVAGYGDISFCPRKFTRKIIDRIKRHSRLCRKAKVLYLQSKEPRCFEPFIADFPDNVVLVTTLETNRHDGYRKISKAPLPSVRYEQFKSLEYPRKVVTIEPVLDFDLRTFAAWIRSIRPEYVWLGFNSKPESVTLPEPSEEKVQELVNRLTDAGIAIRPKTMRGVVLPSVD